MSIKDNRLENSLINVHYSNFLQTVSIVNRAKKNCCFLHPSIGFVSLSNAYAQAFIRLPAQPKHVG